MTGERPSRPEAVLRAQRTRAGRPSDASLADLRARATVAGLRWAQIWFERAAREQRGIEGGWPGTMSEARAQVVHTLVPWLSKQGKYKRGKSPNGELADFEATAKLLYASAREAWRQRAAAGRRQHLDRDTQRGDASDAGRAERALAEVK